MFLSRVPCVLDLERRPAAHQIIDHRRHAIRVALALGIVFLMSVKPGLSGSLATLGIALLVGISASTPAPSRWMESS
jgi:undecaprenyl pyrophosphate phosphatase UppP